MVSALKLVSSETAPEPPYPADTRARGLQFDLDMERVEASDTWLLAKPEQRPWLLMLWATSWRQIPCGSFPDDDDIIAARIGMEPEQFTVWRKTLLRGWVRHADGRLYHPVITERVLGIVAYRTKELKRKQDWRDRRAAKFAVEAVDRGEMSRGTHTGQTCDGHGKDVGFQRSPVYASSSSSSSSSSSKDINYSPANAGPGHAAPDRVPYERIVALYHEMLPELPRVVKLTDARKAQIRARWKGKDAEDLEDWKAYFALVRSSRFLMGLAPASSGRPAFRADLEWLIRESNFTKVLEGRYQ